MLNRLKTVLGARLSSARDGAGDTQAALDAAFARQTELLQQVRTGVTQVAAARNQLEQQARRLEAQLVKLEQEARQALSAGHEDVARRALEVKVGVQQQLRDLDPQIARLEERQRQLTAQQQELAERLARFRAERHAEAARAAAAQTLVTIGESTAGLSDDAAAANDAVRRAHAETARLEARAAAIDELVSTGVFSDGLSADASVRSPGAAPAEVDAELERIRHELGPGGAA